MFGSHEHAARISEVKLKPSAGIKTLLRKEPRRVQIVTLVECPGRLSESVAVMEADPYRPGENIDGTTSIVCTLERYKLRSGSSSVCGAGAA